ncbi:MAG: hypothetical protein WD672_04500 [Woeseia sp.]
MSYFGTLGNSQPDYLPDDGIISPDGRLIIKVTHRGISKSGNSEGTIWLFEVNSVLENIAGDGAIGLVPNVLGRVEAAVNGLPGNMLDRGNVIFEPKWSADSGAVSFLARLNQENRQLFVVDVETSKMTAVTPPSQDVLAYAESDGSYYYLVGPSVDEQDLWRSAGPGIPDVIAGTGVPLLPLLYPNFRGYDFTAPVNMEVWRSKSGAAEPVRNKETGKNVQISSRYSALVIAASQKQDYLATIAFEEPPGESANQLDRFGDHRNLRYRLVDLRTGEIQTLSDEPINDFRWSRSGVFRAAWSPSGDLLAMTETGSPPARGSSALPEESTCVVILFVSEEKTFECLQVNSVSAGSVLYSMKWMDDSELFLTFKTFGGSEVDEFAFSETSGTWSLSKPGKYRKNMSIRLSVKESLNQPPLLVATDRNTNRSRVIFDPNPQFQSIELGEAGIYEWQNSNRQLIRGGIVWPPSYDADRQYPLVIQTHGFNPNRFMKVGYSETANAGRALAARDILVLQVPEPSPQTGELWDYASKTALDTYKSAIDQLARDRIIDKSKVGIAGYSFSGWLVATAIVEASDSFAAAVIANTDPTTLAGYYSYVDTPLVSVVADSMIGARPYADGIGSGRSDPPVSGLMRTRRPYSL